MVDKVDSTKSFTRKYIYNGSEILADLDGSNNVLATYTHSPLRSDDILAAHISTDGVSAGLASSNGSYFFLKDRIGSITAIVDGVGMVKQRYEYSVFGMTSKIFDGSGNDITANPAVTTSFMFTGREFDRETGLYYYRARYYDSSIGRFLQQDPHPGKTSVPTSVVNKYAYAFNDPVNLTDPSGRFPFILVAMALSFAINTGQALNAGLSVEAALLSGAIGAVTTATLPFVGGYVAGALSSTFGYVAAQTIGTVVGATVAGALNGGLNAAAFGGRVGEATLLGGAGGALGGTIGTTLAAPLGLSTLGNDIFFVGPSAIYGGFSINAGDAYYGNEYSVTPEVN